MIFVQKKTKKLLVIRVHKESKVQRKLNLKLDTKLTAAPNSSGSETNPVVFLTSYNYRTQITNFKLYFLQKQMKREHKTSIENLIESP